MPKEVRTRTSTRKVIDIAPPTLKDLEKIADTRFRGNVTAAIHEALAVGVPVLQQNIGIQNNGASKGNFSNSTFHAPVSISDDAGQPLQPKSRSKR
jgi:hypothetical protein